MSDPIVQTEAGAVASVVAQLSRPIPLRLDKSEAERFDVVAMPAGMRLESIKKFRDELREAPERRKGTATLKDLASFIAHARRFSDGDSALFANPDDPSLTSVLDYHQANRLTAGMDPDTTLQGSPRFGTHRGVYSFPLSDEWEAWAARDNDPMKQDAFAEFLENRILDVADPAGAGAAQTKLAATLSASFATPSKLLELSRGLAVRVSAKVHNSKILATGETSMQFVTDHTDANGAPLNVPGAFLIEIPVFKGGVNYQVAARLRYRVREGSISWFYELFGMDRVFDHAFREACATAAEETGLPLFVGVPE